jgi:hypothetical protein
LTARRNENQIRKDDVASRQQDSRLKEGETNKHEGKRRKKYCTQNDEKKSHMRKIKCIQRRRKRRRRRRGIPQMMGALVSS